MAAEDARKVGPHIVRAWFDTVINPLLRGLDSERALLTKEKWTWRFEQGALLSFVPVRSFIAFEALDNLEQFLQMAQDANLCRLVDRHDQQVHLLTAACSRFHDALRDSEPLREIYQRIAVQNAVPLRPGQTFDSLFGAYPPSRHLDVLAEDIVNGSGQQPAYFATAPLWNHYRDELLRLRETPEICPHWEEAQRCGQALNGTVEKLIDSLKSIRQELSLEYDLPLAV